MQLLISGYFGFGNAGDEWILEALLAALAPLGHKITVLSADPEATQIRHAVRAVDRWHPGVLGRELVRCQALIFGGGGLIQDVTGPWTPAYYLGLHAAAMALGRRVLWLGQGLGPVRRTWNTKLSGWILPGAEGLVVRDTLSRDWCLARGLASEKIVLSADWVWTLPAPKVRPGALWVVCPRADQMTESLERNFMDLRALARQQGKTLRWLVLGNRGDESWLNDFARRRAIPRDHLWNLSGLTFAQAAARLAGTEWMFSMRYHGLVLGAVAGAAVTGWGEDDKLHSVLRDLGTTAWIFSKSRRKLGESLAQSKAVRALVQRRVAVLRRLAQANGRVLHQALERSSHWH